MEMVAGGTLLGFVGIAAGEPAALRVATVSTASLIAVGYLIVFGSLLAFSAYVWLLRAAPVSLVATYAYVNPVVAVVLGWALLDEAVTPPMLLAGAVIVVAVALIAGAAPPVTATDDQDMPAAAAAS
jgi:drug/metabolite transporter (DMT)-like permease